MSDAFFDFEVTSDTSPVGEVEVSNDEANKVAETLSPTAKELVAKEKELAELEASVKPLTDERNALIKAQRDLREEMNKRLAAMNEREQELHTLLYDSSKQIRSLKMEIDSLRRKLALELEAERQKAEFQENAVKFSKIIAQYQYSDKILTHQKEGAFFLATAGRAILGDKRGLGKTLTSLATADMLQAQKILVLCPDDVLSNFVNEINYWAPHRNVFAIGKLTKQQREIAFKLAADMSQFIIVCNYSAWRKDKSMLDSFVKLGLEMVIADEAHELKNTNTSAYKGVEKIVLSENCCPMCKSLELSNGNKDMYGRYYQKCMKCEWQSNSTEQTWEPLDRCSVRYMFPMTGTVILNKPQDMFAMLHLVDPVIFKEERDFLRMYCVQGWDNKWRFASGGLERLTQRLSARYIARDEKSAGVVRPKQSIIVHEIEFDRERYAKQWRVIEQLSKHAQILLDSGKKMNIMATISLILRKRQANVWPAGIQLKDDNGTVVFSVAEDVTESVKLDKCVTTNPYTHEHEGLIPELTEDGDKELGARVVVFSQFKGPLMELERRLENAGISVVRFDGDTDEHTKSLVKVDFDRKFCEAEDYNNGLGYRWQVCLANYRTGGVGLNFTAATETIFLDEEWNPGKADQAMGRTDRMGQTEETNVHILRIPGTIDTWMVALNEQKQEIIEGFEQSASNVAMDLLEAMRNGDIV